jgi:hypothetical protein
LSKDFGCWRILLGNTESTIGDPGGDEAGDHKSGTCPNTEPEYPSDPSFNASFCGFLIHAINCELFQTVIE